MRTAAFRLTFWALLFGGAIGWALHLPAERAELQRERRMGEQLGELRFWLEIETELRHRHEARDDSIAAAVGGCTPALLPHRWSAGT